MSGSMSEKRCSFWFSLTTDNDIVTASLFASREKHRCYFQEDAFRQDQQNIYANSRNPP